MIAPNFNLMCEVAKACYYDYLCQENRGHIPPEILAHIKQCSFCQAQADKLKFELARSAMHNEENFEQINSATTANLRLHFAFIDKHVTCQTVKPFLPMLLDAVLTIRIPTPITVHLDNCQQCSDDLKAIEKLNLDSKKLSRLSWFLADNFVDKTVSCSQAKPFIKFVAAMNWEGTTLAILKHLSKCSKCRDLLYKERQHILENLPEYEQSPESPCQSVSDTNIFDYCFPYGIDPANDQYAKFREPLTSHLSSCRNCMAKIQQLHNTIYGISQRPESGIATIYTTDQSDRTEPENQYAGFPIKVEVIDSRDKTQAERSGSTVDFAAALKRKSSAMNFGPLLKGGIAAAAVILIIFALFFNTSTAKATTIEQIYKAIEKIKSVYIAAYYRDQKEPIQEKWVSRELNVYITKAEKETVLWDLANKTRTAKHTDTGTVETIPLTAEKVTGIKRMVAGSLGLVPFADISAIPPDAEWNRISNDSLGIVDKDTEVYELTWTEKRLDDSPKLWKWRVFVDPKTNQPKRTESYQKLTPDGEYILEIIKVIDYLSNNQIRTILEETPF